MSNAAVAAAAACDVSVSPAAMTCRRLMPVRVAIHSSFVSTKASRSVLVSTASGVLLPLPVSLQPLSCRPVAPHVVALAARLDARELSNGRWWRGIRKLVQKLGVA